ncbi:hypothetical protein BX600DRAFT_467889 [Xylariales sp. PMI_506]|nr:hypothetical protein BX600DRAFT_467889 [Xylariales sp. PMI_506]
MANRVDDPDIIQLGRMPQLAEALEREDDWTGITDLATRRKLQTRLNTRAYRRRKALQRQVQNTLFGPSKPTDLETGVGMPCWDEGRQTVRVIPRSRAQALYSAGKPLLAPQLGTSASPAPEGKFRESKILFPLSSDHLIVLIQYNVLRACLVNRLLITPLHSEPVSDCSSGALSILRDPSLPQDVPASLLPTHLQRTVPHEDWVDIIPHPVWRDNLLRAIGFFNEDELWSDTIGGLFEGFPGSESQKRGVIVWSPPWDVNGWEISEGFWRKWRWTFEGCEDILEVTNRWRRERGEDPLVY